MLLAIVGGCGRVQFEQGARSDASCNGRGFADGSTSPRDATIDGARPTDGWIDGSIDGAMPRDAGSEGGRTPTSLIGHWRLDEGSGSIASDSSSWNAAGGLQPDANGWVTGRFGRGFSARERRIVVPAGPWLQRIAASNALTVTAWIRIDSLTVGYRAIVSRQAGTQNGEHLGLYLTADNNRPFALVTDGSTYAECAGLTATATMRWVHLAMTWDGAAIVGYVDGVEACRGTGGVRMRDDTTPLVVGANVNNAAFEESFGGDLDEIAIYDRALRADEIARIARGEAFVAP